MLNGGQIDPFLGSVGPAAPGAEHHGGNARRRQQGRIHPKALPDHGGRLTQHLRCGLLNGLDDGRVWRGTKRVTGEGQAMLGVERRIGGEASQKAV